MMKIQSGLSFVAGFALVITGVFIHSGCANIGAPTGGPRDTLPPVLISALPQEFKTNVKDNKIVFKFDEYIDAKDIRAQLIVSPLPKVEPITDGRLQTVTVKLKDTLQPNTTYYLNFYKGIKDVNEGNVLRDFTYVFSTGNHIDSGQFAGNVVLAYTGKVDSTITVMLHKKFDDSAVAKDRPRYITRVDTNGRFVFRYLEPGRYAVYAMKDESGSYKYLSKAQLFAFADSPVVISQYTPPVTLYAYSEVTDSKPSSKTGSGGPTSGSTPAKSTTKSSKLKDKDKRLVLTTNTTNSVFDILDTFRLTATTGLKTFDSTLIRFTDENFKDINLKTYHWIRDTTNKNFALSFFWPLDTRYYLVLDKSFALDSAGRKLPKDDTISFRTKKDIDYGEIRIRIFNLDLTRHPVLLFFQAEALKYSFPFGNKREIRKYLFKPGDYELRILYDLNENGKWDPGTFFTKRRQPERVITIRKKFPVKANWDNDWDYNLQ